MSDHVAGGNRRIDRVLAEDYLAGLEGLPMAELRELRQEAEQEEVDLSFLRRLLQGRLDILAAELDRRSGSGDGGGTTSLVDQLPRILADEPRPAARGRGRHTVLEPSRVDQHRRRVEALVADVGLSDVAAQDEATLSAGLDRLRAEERTVSAQRQRVQEVLDACTAEVTRRYREGEADVADLLADEVAEG